MLGAIMKSYKYPIAVSGTHGKTTTTSMISHILLASELDPTILLGGELNLIGGNIRVSNSDYFVCEACEYHESFLKFFPYISIVLNVEEDHLDYFSGIDHIIRTFRGLIDLTPDDGAVIVNSDDENALSACKGSGKNIIYVSLKNDSGFTAKNISYSDTFCASFDVYRHGINLGRITLSVPGKYNILNALAAIAAADFLNIDFVYIKKGLNEFKGVHRRYEHKGNKNGIEVIDDYAHHPTEIAATLSAVKSTAAKNIWCVFQPHTYTRTYSLFEDFVAALSCGINVIITDIYSARERDTGLVSSKKLSDSIENAVYLSTFEDCVDFLNKNAESGDIILTMGAGDVYKVGEMFLES